ncbi:MAG: hypothetical protein GX594_00760 [Pirellulaceae bacterium]|nr:hypothetical protein [Pirellulaceae bacterium]
MRWAFGVARLEILKHRQARGSRAVVFRSDLIDIAAEEIMEVSEKSDALGEALRKCVEKLSPWHLVVLRQRFEAGKSVREIAQGFNRSEAAVYKTLQGIYDALYECVQAEVPGRTKP